MSEYHELMKALDEISETTNIEFPDDTPEPEGPFIIPLGVTPSGNVSEVIRRIRDAVDEMPDFDPSDEEAVKEAAKEVAKKLIGNLRGQEAVIPDNIDSMTEDDIAEAIENGQMKVSTAQAIGAPTERIVRAIMANNTDGWNSQEAAGALLGDLFYLILNKWDPVYHVALDVIQGAEQAWPCTCNDDECLSSDPEFTEWYLGFLRTVADGMAEMHHRFKDKI